MPEIGYATSDNGMSWSKYGANPVLIKGTSGAWDDEGVGSSCVIWDDDDNLYKMWYTGTPDNSSGATPGIGYATSPDGVDWTKYGTEPVIQAGSSGAWDDAGVLSPNVIKESDTSYKMWYSGRSADGGIGNLRIGYATSPDGVNWTKYGTEPVIAKGIDPDWDSRGVGVGTVIIDRGTYEIWFTGYKGSGESEFESAIGYASSSNGISWTKSGSNPVLEGDSGWESNGVGAPWVTHSGRTYRLWYSGLDTNFDTTLGYASYTSPLGPSGGGGFGPSAPSPGTTDVSDYVDKDGVFTEDVTAESEDGNCRITIDEGTTGLTEDGRPLSEISITPMEKPPLPPDSANIIGLVYDIEPDGATFDPPITLCFSYDPDLVPEGVAEENLVIAMWDEEAGEWVNLDSTVNPATNTICVSLSHLTPFTVLAYTRPASFITSNLNITPEEVDIGETVTISVSVGNTGDLIDSYEVTLKIGDLVVATEDVTLAGGASQTATFTVVEDVAGTYTVNVNSLTGVFMVKAAPPSPSPSPPPPSPSPPPPPSPLPPPAEPINWWFIGGMIAVFVAVAVITSLAITRIIRR